MPYDAPATDDFNPDLPDDDTTTLPLDEVIRLAIEAKTMGLRVCQPAKVTAVSGEQKVDLQLLLQVRYISEDSAIDQPVIQNVPVSMPMGANYSIKLPVAVGDVGWCIFCDRSMDTFLASDGSTTVDPSDARQHHVSDPIFVPGLPTFSTQTQDGTTDLVVTNGQGQVRVLANGKVQLKNQTQEALNLLDQLITALSNIVSAFTTAAPAITIGAPTGPLPLNPALVSALSGASTTLATVQANLATLKV
jgi:hypothetical protein